MGRTSWVEFPPEGFAMGRPHLTDSSRNEMSHAPPAHTSSFFLTGIDEIWKASWRVRRSARGS
ncbi:hypothetical protein RHGRI_037421 [Rhododendron griersonianum]|uniref:Uncharacterized protein n=1 Tax=Rhododendron griersonianum TaxID=479676 RepID=A0AAV6HVB9_9ERIC|nr:hypothetical protein RHGRI_037421 [Rhododendron griersonianum]